jgi:hypothetical protein
VGRAKVCGREVPRGAAKCAPLATWRLLSAAIRRSRIVVLYAAVLSPHLHVADGIEQTKSVAAIATHRRGKQSSIVAGDAFFPLWKAGVSVYIANVSVLTNIFGCRTPGIRGRCTRPDGIFHFRGSRQAIRFSCLLRKPMDIGPSVVPAQTYRGLILLLLVAWVAPTGANFSAILATAFIGKASDRSSKFGWLEGNWGVFLGIGLVAGCIRESSKLTSRNGILP